jgi:general secretion pathway protein G
MKSKHAKVRIVFRASHRGFSLIELVIVVVIIAVIGAIAIPRLSRGSEGANDSALQSNWAALRKAIDLYAAEHSGAYPQLARASQQLTSYTDELGEPSAVKDSTYVYGPYIRTIPAISSGPRAGQNGIGLLDGPTIGWIYLPGKGEIRPNIPLIPQLDGEADEVSALSGPLE